MERFAYIMVCIAAIAVLAMVIMVVAAVLKVSSEQDDAYDMTERIKFQAQEGLRQRDEYTTEEVYAQRRDAHDCGVVEENRHIAGDAQDEDMQV